MKVFFFFIEKIFLTYDTEINHSKIICETTYYETNQLKPVFHILIFVFVFRLVYAENWVKWYDSQRKDYELGVTQSAVNLQSA